MGISPYVCCPDSCYVTSDDFNRPDSTDLGCWWRERSGNWSVHTNRLRESGNAGALVIAETPAPEISFRVSAQSPNVPAGAVYRVVANYLDDNNYHFAEFEFPTGRLIVRLYKRSGGVNTKLKERQWDVNMVGNPQELGVCFTEKIFSAGQKYEPYMAWITNPVPIQGGYRAGLGNGGGVQIEYDDFRLDEHYDTNPDCLICVCRCDDFPLPMDLTARCTFSGGLGDCQPVDVPLQAVVPSEGWESNEQWYGWATVDCSDCPDPLDPFTLHVIFRCESPCGGDPDKHFWVWAWATDVGGDGTACNLPGGLNCDPVSIPFEKISPWSEGGYCSGQSGDSTDLEIEVME